MKLTCQGITLSGNQCHRKIKDQTYCYQHRPTETNKKYIQPKPDECCVCCESLKTQKRPLSCGHWIHTSCIISSAKAECPVCRTKLTLNKRAMNKINRLARKRKAEELAEEEEELRMELQYQVADLIAPALQERIQDVIGNLLNENDDINASDVLIDVFDDDLYQNFLQNLLGFELQLES